MSCQARRYVRRTSFAKAGRIGIGIQKENIFEDAPGKLVRELHVLNYFGHEMHVLMISNVRRACTAKNAKAFDNVFLFQEQET